MNSRSVRLHSSRNASRFADAIAETNTFAWWGSQCGVRSHAMCSVCSQHYAANIRPRTVRAIACTPRSHDYLSRVKSPTVQRLLDGDACE